MFNCNQPPSSGTFSRMSGIIIYVLLSAAHEGGGTDTEIRKLEKKILLPQFPAGLVVCCFTSAETVGLLGTGAQDGHLDFHTAPELCRETEPAATSVSLTERLSPPLLLLSAPPHFSFVVPPPPPTPPRNLPLSV